jgi:ribosomal protein S18 acetylase RimI-like enzyme
MSELRCIPLSRLEENLLLPLLHEEERSWMSDLNWDYSAVCQILISFVRQKLLPGYVAIENNNPIGYTYFLVNQAKGIIGALYMKQTHQSQLAVDNLLSLTISSLKHSPTVNRIEAQIIPFNNSHLTTAFERNGFDTFARYFLDLELSGHRKSGGWSSAVKIIPWSSSYLERAAEMSLLAYRNQTDAEICEDYRTKAGCETYLRSLIENPGCGIFMPKASFMAVDMFGLLCGFLICSRISDGNSMIPQIAVHPSHQAKGIGNALMVRSFECLKEMGYRRVSLTVTGQNRRAFEWYQRLGFRVRKEFGAYVWQRG